MKVLTLNQTILKWLGIIESPNDIRMVISQYICLISPILLLIPSIAYFLVNFQDVAQATSAFYLICITGMGLLTYLDCLIKRSTVLSIIQRLQQIIDSVDSNFQQFYENCERQTNQIVHYFRIFVFTSVYTVISLPIVVLIFEWLNGNYSKDSLMLPASLL